jgi:phosphatidylserine decarboxylase
MKIYILAQLVSCIALTDAFMVILPSQLRNARSVSGSSSAAGVEDLLERYRLQNKLGSSFDFPPSSQLCVNIQRDYSELANEDVLPGPTVPIPEAWSEYDEESLLAHVRHLLTSADGSMTQTRTFLTSAMTEVCNPILTPDTNRTEFWKPYRDGDKDIVEDFFKPWLRYSPEPDEKHKNLRGPSLYIVYWDWLANTSDGRKLTGSDIGFRKWFVQFLELRGKWINSVNSGTTMDAWMEYKGNPAHPFNVTEYAVPEGGFKTFNQFFRRSIRASVRPMNETASIVSPADGGAFYLQKESTDMTNHATHTLEEKSKDQFNLADALPCYGNSFIGGPLVDILLWFTDYHHFHAPVDGKLIHVAEYQGSYNYDFDNFDPNDPYAPKPPPDSDAAGWYKNLNKHKRTAWIIKTEDMGLVAMIAIGFWGVGSISSDLRPGQTLKKGDYMGHFGYGGSSILLAFEPMQNIKFDGLSDDTGEPVLVKVRQGLEDLKSVEG